MERKAHTRGLAVAVAAVLVLACNGAGGGGGVSGTSSVSGSTDGLSFDFIPAQVGAIFSATRPTEGELSVFLCETACPSLGGAPHPDSRSVSLFATGESAAFRVGDRFVIGSDAMGNVQYGSAGGATTEDAVSGEIIVDSSDLRVTGSTVGTFQLQLSGGGWVRGFFEAPFVAINGPVASLP